jgi:hypothetical protein
MKRSWQCALWFFAALVPVSADPILTYQITGDFQLQQTGNEITGHYQIQDKSNDNFYLIVKPGTGNVIGDFQLIQNAALVDDFEAEHLTLTIPNDYEIVMPGQMVTGDFVLQQTGNEISGNYNLAVQTQASTPEPATLLLLIAGTGLIVLSRCGARTRACRVDTPVHTKCLRITRLES